MVTREGVLIIIPCPVCEHDMLRRTGLVIISGKTKCQCCDRSFFLEQLHVFRALGKEKCIKVLDQNKVVLEFPVPNLESPN